MKELKPCPLCDGSPLLNPGPYDWDCGGRYYYSASIECACGLTLEVDNPGPKVYTDDDDEALGFVIAAWNARAERTCSMEYNEYWSGDELYPTEAYQCAVCGRITQEGLPNYCPNCGAKVVGSDEAKEV